MSFLYESYFAKELRKKAPKTLADVKRMTEEEWASVVLPITTSSHAARLKKISIILKHLRSYTSLVRDAENIVSKVSIWGKAVKLSRRNFMTHQMKLARAACLPGQTMSRRSRLWGHKQRTLEAFFCLLWFDYEYLFFSVHSQKLFL